MVHFDGVRDIRFGQVVAELVTRGLLTPESAPCGRTLAGIEEAVPVFAEDKLVLLWFNPPLATPEGVTVGTALAVVRQRYPNAVELTPPAGSYSFPGLLVASGDRAYLFLHDGAAVQKAVVGFERYARRLFETGFGSC